jgi:HAD superfamily hydrolase (TIGR01509 family)
MKTQIKAIIFDMDGVLIDAKEWHYEALNRALSLFGFEISKYEHLVTYDGLPTKKKLEMLTLERGLPCRLHAFINQLKQDYTLELAHTLCKPTFQHQLTVKKLRHRGFRLAVCSNSIRQTVDVMTSRSALAEHFEVTLSNQDVCKPKPDPEIYLTALRLLDLTQNECIVVEDNANGVKAATAAGIKTLVVSDIADVNFDNIMRFIYELEHGSA